MLRQGKLFDSLSDVCFALRQLNIQQSSFKYQERLKSIMEGACEANGVFSRHIIHHLTTPPSLWADKQDQLLESMGPESEFQRRMVDTAKLHTSIDAQLIPKNLLDDFPKHAAFESRRMVGLRKDAAGVITVGLWDWFWSCIIHALLQLPQPQAVISSQQSGIQDELYHQISVNFYLLLIQRTLTKLASSNPKLHSRLVFLIQINVVEQLFFKIRGKSTDVHYRLKSQHLHLLFLIIHGRKIEDETAEYYYDYLQMAAQNYSSVAGTQGGNIRNLIRIWLALSTRQSGIGSVLLDKLAKANHQQRCYRLARCPPQSFAEAMVKVDTGNRMLHKAMVCRGHLLRLLKKVSEWTPDYSHLAVIQQILIYDEKILQRFNYPQQESESQLLLSSSERILLKLAQEQAEIDHLKDLHHRMSKLLSSRQKGASVLHVTEQELIQRRKEPQMGDLSNTSLFRRNGISYYNPRRRNVWAYPIQDNQFHILYQGMLWLAQLIDKLIPGHSQRRYPLLNLRIFCNPTVFVGVLLLGVIVYRLLE